MLLRWLLLRWLFPGWLPLRWLLFTLHFNKTSLEETGCLGNPYFLRTGYLRIQFFDLSPFSNHSQLGCLWLPTPHFAALVWLTGHHTIPLVIKGFPSNPYQGGKRFSLGVASILSNESLPTHLVWLPPVNNNSRLRHVKTKNVLLVVKNLIKKHKVVAPRISNHFSQLSVVLISFT